MVLLSDYPPVLDHTPDLYLLPTLPTGVDHRRTRQTHRKRKSQVRIYKRLLLVRAYTLGDTLTRNSMSESAYLYISPLHILYL